MAFVGHSRTRRAVLVGALGGLGALVAQAIGRPAPIAAGGGAVVLGEINISDSDSDTRVDRMSGSTVLTRSVLGGEDIALQGNVLGLSGSGVLGRESAIGSTGVEGWANATNGTAVLGRTDGHNSQIAVDADVSSGLGEGIAVRARTRNGIALYGQTLDTGGYALQAVGRTVFSRSGKTTFLLGQASKVVTGFPLTGESLVVATIQDNVAGTWVRSVIVNAAQSKFTIKLNKPAPTSLFVGWFIVN